MAVNSSGIKPLDIVKCNRRVDRETEDTSSSEVPQAPSDKAVDRPLICLDPWGGTGELVVVVSLKTDQNQRNNLHSTEGSS